MRLYIDDIRIPLGHFDLILRSSKEVIHYLSNNPCPEYISFDHDLGEDDTSMIIIKYMVTRDLDEGNFIPRDFNFNVHSANPVGKANIEGYLNSYLKRKV